MGLCSGSLQVHGIHGFYQMASIASTRVRATAETLLSFTKLDSQERSIKGHMTSLSPVIMVSSETENVIILELHRRSRPHQG